MFRMIGAVIGGYLVSFVLVFCLLAGLYAVLGTEGTFRPGTYHLSTTWMVAAMVLGFAAYVAAGFVARLIAPGSSAPLVLAVAVVGLGLLFAIPVLKAARIEPEIRPPGVTMLEAMSKARQPTAATLGGPVLGAIAVVLGGRLRRSGAGR